MTAEARVARARELVSLLIDDLCTLIAISESNRFVIYSPVLARQIPKSYAANAFKVFQWCSLNYEILRTCALWDAPREDRVSIPTVVKLVEQADAHAVVEQGLGSNPNSPYVAGQMRRLHRAMQIAERVKGARFKQALYDFRNRQLAHTLHMADASATETVPKYGYERRLLRASIAIVSNLNNAIRDSSFAFDMAIEQSKRNADALWNGCKFQVLR